MPAFAKGGEINGEKRKEQSKEGTEEETGEEAERIILRYLRSLSQADKAQLRSVEAGAHGLIVVWGWLPMAEEHMPEEFEHTPLFHVMIGDYDEC